MEENCRLLKEISTKRKDSDIQAIMNEVIRERKISKMPENDAQKSTQTELKKQNQDPKEVEVKIRQNYAEVRAVLEVRYTFL